jgi:DNA-binding response OmpR family regulator
MPRDIAQEEQRMGEKIHILVVDDDSGIRDSLSAFLRRSGFEVYTANDGQHALDDLEHYQVDLLILDVLMPRLDGRETLRRLRQSENWVPVILLTQVGEATERAMALEEGADDYLNKPFEPHELVARIRAVLRRASKGVPPLTSAWVLKSGDLRLNRSSRRVSLAGEEIILTPKALLLLEYLMTHPDELISRERLLDVVWGWEQAVATRAVDARIAELRRVLHDQPDQPAYIETVPGFGYRFIAIVERSK